MSLLNSQHFNWLFQSTNSERLFSSIIFLGVTEAPLLVKPCLPKMTRSELFAVMCGGLASIAGTMLVSYAQLGVKMEYLLAASFMAAPDGLLLPKCLRQKLKPLMIKMLKKLKKINLLRSFQSRCFLLCTLRPIICSFRGALREGSRFYDEACP